jgi:acetyl esterase/lipase
MPEFVTCQVPGIARRALNVDVFRPTGRYTGLGVILLHGGGWVQGHRSMMYPYSEALAACGHVAIAAEYRLLPEAPWPAQVDDVRDVVRWTKANCSELGVNPSKIALQGFSAGAHLALMVGGTQPGSDHERALGVDSTGSDVGAIVSFFAPAKLDVDPGALLRPPFSLLLNGGGMEAARAASPIYYIHAGFPTTFLLGGMADYMQSLARGLSLLKAFTDVGAEVEFHYLHSQVHEFPSTPGMLQPIMAEVDFFYRRTLLERDELARESREHNIFARAGNAQEFAALMAQR